VSARTSIAWTDATANVVVGCSRVSEGCRNCYAERLAATRLRHLPLYIDLTTWQRRWSGTVRLSREAMRKITRWRAPRRIFVTSMGDPFHESLHDDELHELWGWMAALRYRASRGGDVFPWHTLQLLTKRPARARAYLSAAHSTSVRERWAHGGVMHAGGANPDALWDSIAIDREPLGNVWLGTSVENAATVAERIPELLATPAALRFISAEPLLEPIDLTPYLRGSPRLDWVIVGGESGPGARRFHLSWARTIVEQCREAGVPCFAKQIGKRPVLDPEFGYDPGWLPPGLDSHPARSGEFATCDASGSDPSEWPPSLRVRESPLAWHEQSRKDGGL
jgi:protein gp37